MGLQTGDKCPLFALPDQNGQIVRIEEWIGTQLLVIYFYPKDDTPGCTKEACAFRDQYEVFEEAGCKVIGISADSVEAHTRFAAKYALHFTLLADTDKHVRTQFGVPGNLFGLIDGRVTYIVDLKGIIRAVHNSQLNPGSHIRKALETIQTLQQERV